jgi:hypothetical protein
MLTSVTSHPSRLRTARLPTGDALPVGDSAELVEYLKSLTGTQ